MVQQGRDRREKENKDIAWKEGAENFHSNTEENEFLLFENCKFSASKINNLNSKFKLSKDM